MKKVLESLLSLDKSQFDSEIKKINPSVNDEDLKPMFPENWSSDNRWPLEREESNAERWKRWEPHQLAIDRMMEEMVGCYDSDDDC
jgi:hypothetical protein